MPGRTRLNSLDPHIGDNLTGRTYNTLYGSGGGSGSVGSRAGNAAALRGAGEQLEQAWRSTGIPRLGQAVAYGADLPMGQRVLHMAANTEQYLPSKVTNFFSSSNPVRHNIGRRIAEGFGWYYESGGPDGKDWTKLGKSQGWMGTKAWTGGGFTWGKAGRLTGGILSLGYTVSMMKGGWDESGATGAVGGGALALGEAYAFRKIAPKLLGGVAWSNAKGGYAVGRAAAVGRLTSGVATGRAAYYGARAAGVVAGLSLGGVGYGIGMLANPYLLAIGAAAYTYGQVSEGIDRANRGNTRLRQVAALEMGAPILDQYGSIATLRQRSLAALQNSHVNGRMALGNEAALLH